MSICFVVLRIPFCFLFFSLLFLIFSFLLRHWHAAALSPLSVVSPSFCPPLSPLLRSLPVWNYTAALGISHQSALHHCWWVDNEIVLQWQSSFAQQGEQPAFGGVIFGESAACTVSEFFLSYSNRVIGNLLTFAIISCLISNDQKILMFFK